MKYVISRIVFLSLILSVLACSNDDDSVVKQLSTPERIDALRRVQINEDLKFGETSITGIVLNDPSSGNFEDGLLAVQQEGTPAAIILQLTNAVNYELGQEVEINLQGATLTEIEGELQVKNLSAVQVSPTGKIVEPIPTLTDLSTIAADAPYWGPILVKVDNLTVQSSNEKLGGDSSVNDGVVSSVMRVLNSASFAGENTPEKLTSLIGVVRIQDGQPVIFPRNPDDIALAITELLEDFEADTNTSYDVKTLSLRTGSWILSGGITASTSADLKNGSQSIRLQGSIGNEDRNGILSMEFDLEGVKGIRFSHGIYPAGAETSNVNPTTVDVEISKDGGNTYSFLGQVTIDIQSDVLITDEFAVEADDEDEVRFRFVNTSAPFANNNRPRISLDDVIFIY